MSVIYVARSETVTEWASDVGLGKNIYKVGVADGADEALAALNKGVCGGADWTMVSTKDAGELDESAVIEKLAKKEKQIDPKFYPRLRGTLGLFKIKLENVENHILVKKALEGADVSAVKIKPAEIAAYILANAGK